LPLSPDSEGFSTLHIWLDGSVIETFVDKRQVVTTRTYATGDESAGLHVVWLGATASLQSLTICNLKPISEDRLTS
jgi:beta-fructofuranosidase